jgi:hypothetical protein
MLQIPVLYCTFMYSACRTYFPTCAPTRCNAGIVFVCAGPLHAGTLSTSCSAGHGPSGPVSQCQQPRRHGGSMHVRQCWQSAGSGGRQAACGRPWHGGGSTSLCIAKCTASALATCALQLIGGIRLGCQVRMWCQRVVLHDRGCSDAVSSPSRQHRPWPASVTDGEVVPSSGACCPVGQAVALGFWLQTGCL